LLVIIPKTLKKH